MALSVQDLLLRVRGESDDASKDLEQLGRELLDFDRSEAEATLDLNADAVQRKLKDARAEMARFARETAEAKADIDTDAARAKLTGFKRLLDSVDRDDVSPEVDVQLANAYREIAGLDHTLDKIERREVTVDVEVRKDLISRFTQLAASSDQTSESFSKTERRTISLSHGFNLVQGAIGLLKWPALITGAGFAARALSTVTGGAVAFAGAIGPALGALLVERAQAMLALGQATATIRIAQLDGIAQALNGDKDALKALAPPARAFAEQLLGLKDRFDGLRDSVQRRLFAGLAPEIKDTFQNFDVLKGIMNGTAEALNHLLKRAADLVASPEFGHLLSRIGQENTSVISHMGDAALNLAPALLQVLDSARPLTEWIVKGIEAWSRNAAAMVDNAHKTGDLTKFFQHAKQAIAEIVDIGGNLIHSLISIGAAGRSTGMDLLRFLGRAAEDFRKWVDSASGQNALEKYFRAIEPPLKEAFRLVGDLLKSFFALGHGADLTGLIRSLRTELLPILTELVKGTTKAFGPHLIELLKAFATLLLRMAGSSGPLTLYVDALTVLAKVLNFLFDTIPGVQTATVDLLAAFALYKTLAGPIGLIKSFATAIGIVGTTSATAKGEVAGMNLVAGEGGGVMGKLGSAISAGFSAVKNAIVGVAKRAAEWFAVTFTTTAAAETKAGAILGPGSPFGKRAATSSAESGAQSGGLMSKAFGVAAIAAIVLIAAELVHAFDEHFGKQIEGALHGAYDAINDFAHKLGPLGQVMAMPFKLIITTIQTFWHLFTNLADLIDDLIHGRWADAWKDARRFVLDFVKDAIQGFRAILAPFESLLDILIDASRIAWREISRLTSEAWRGIRDAILDPVRAVRGALGDAWDAIKDAARDSWRAIADVARDVWGAIGDSILAPVRDARGGLGDVWGTMKDVAHDAWAAIRDIARDLWSAIKDAILEPMRDSRGGLGDVWDVMKSVAHDAWAAIKDVAGDIWGGIKDAILQPIRDARGALADVWDVIKGAAADTWRGTKDVAEGVWGNIKSAIMEPMHATRVALGEVWDTIKGIAGDAWRAIKDVASDVWQNIKGAIVSPVRDAFDAIKNIIGNLKDWVRDAVSWVKDKLSFVTDLADKIGGIIDTIKGALDSLPGGGGLPGIPNIPGPLSSIPTQLAGQLAGTGTPRTQTMQTTGARIHAPVTVQPVAPGSYPDVDSFAAQLMMRLRTLS